MKPFQYFEPSTLAEALEILHHYQDRARVLAGGTDLVVQMKQAKTIPEAVVSLRRLQELDFIEVDSGIRMGPRVTMTQIANHPAFAGRFSILKEAALAVADVQIRNLATVGGNIANASPSADVPPALVAWGAWNFVPPEDDAKPVESIVKQLCDEWGSGARFRIGKGKHPHEAHYLRLDCTKARTELGWSPRWDLPRTIQGIVEWTKVYREKRDVRRACLAQINEYERCGENP